MSRASYLSLRLLRAVEYAERARDVVGSLAEDLSHERGPALADLSGQAHRIGVELARLCCALHTAEAMVDAAARAEQQIEIAGNPAGAPATDGELCSHKYEAGGVTSQERPAIPPGQPLPRDRAIQGAAGVSIESRCNPAASPSALTGVGAGGNHEVGNE